jgi:DNA (cytosine-5)-methyltransferase 1
MTELTHLSLFSGIGGLDLAAEAAGFQTVGQCEWADYPTKVLEKHWPGVPRWRDIRTLTGDGFYARTGRRSATVISGGFPCQPFSVAGKRRGKEDDRYLWPEMCRVISEIRPAWVIGENVPGIVNLALDTVLSDLESEGYTCQTFIIPAAGVGAPHRRDRIAIVAYSTGTRTRDQAGTTGMQGWNISKAGTKIIRQKDGTAGTSRIDTAGHDVVDTDGPCGERKISNENKAGSAGYSDSGSNVSNTDRAGCQKFNSAGKPEEQSFNSGIHSINYVSNSDNRRGPLRRDGQLSATPETESGWSNNRDGTPEYVAGQWWPAEPDVGRVANGIPSRVDRLKCLGNAVVPQQFYPFFKYIAEIERSKP